MTMELELRVFEEFDEAMAWLRAGDSDPATSLAATAGRPITTIGF